MLAPMIENLTPKWSVNLPKLVNWLASLNANKVKKISVKTQVQ